MSLESVDHLVFAAPTLESGMAEVDRRLGMPPAPGGRHPDLGTHNALLSLGPATYLEVVAPDPQREPAGRAVAFGMRGEVACRIATWALRVDSIEAMAERLAKSGLDVGAVSPGRRVKPDGAALTWKLSDPFRMAYDGAIPFLIEWGRTVHPARSAPVVGALVALRLEHPQVRAVREAWKLLGVDLPVLPGERCRFRATVRTPSGDVELE